MSKKQKKALVKIITAFVLFLVLVICEHTGVLPAVFESRLWSTLLFLIPYLICGYDVIFDAFHGILHGHMLDESFLMTLASIGAFVTGEAHEACAVMLFYQVGEFFQNYAVNKSRRSISDLMDIAPEFANIERPDGTIETVDPDEVSIDDILIIKPGENIPVDGLVISGYSTVNTSALTGESVPRTAHENDRVLAGCINGDGTLRIKAEKLYEDSAVAKILELVENAADKKSRTENFITRFARYYTPIVVAAAVILAFVPPIFTGNLGTWIYRACTFLVISCPCALVISVPLAFFAGIGAASSKGVLVKGSNYLELLSQIDTLVTDKTGTLTKGTFSVNKIIPAAGISEEQVLERAALAESMSTHPIALSIIEAADKMRSDASDSEPAARGEKRPQGAGIHIDNVAGKGIIAHSGDDTILAGNKALLKDNNIEPDLPDVPDAATCVYVAENGRYLGVILISDEIKPEAKEAIEKLRRSGVKNIIMLTGDVKKTGDAIGRELGLDKVYSELLPQDKVDAIENIIKDSRGGKVAYIGDGINDAPVLSRSDIGIAMGSLGSDAAIEAADVVIMDDNLLRLPEVKKTAGRTTGISKQNIAFALAVKLLVLILGAAGIANMWAAVFADVGVAVLCILNSMRLLRTGKKKTTIQ